MSYAAIQTRDNAEPRAATAGTVALWAVQIALTAFFLMGGLTKLTGAPEMVGLFEAIGAGQWFRYLTGALEVGGPRCSSFRVWPAWVRCSSPRCWPARC